MKRLFLKEPRPRTGFTMLELVIASGVLLIAVMGLASFYHSPMVLNELARDTTIALQDASQVIEQIGVAPFEDIQETDWDHWAQNHGAKNLPDEIITVSYTEIVSNNVLEFAVTVQWTRRSRTRDIHLTSRKSRASES